MRIDVKTEQKNFWKAFDEKLIENGEPFSILYEKGGEVTYWAVVNKKQSFVDNALSIDFLVKKQKLRINIYVRNDLVLFSIFEKNRKDVEAMVDVPLKWIEGTRNKNTRRIAYEIPVNTGDYSNFDEAIDQVLPVIVAMKNVCEKYAKKHFFDF